MLTPNWRVEWWITRWWSFSFPRVHGKYACSPVQRSKADFGHVDSPQVLPWNWAVRAPELTFPVRPLPSARPCVKAARSISSSSRWPKRSTASLLVMLATKVVWHLIFKPRMKLWISLWTPSAKQDMRAESRSPWFVPFYNSFLFNWAGFHVPRQILGAQPLVHTLCQFARLHREMSDADSEYVLQDCASSEFYNEEEKKYDLDFKNPNSDRSKWVTYEQLAEIYKHLVSKYPIVSIEDPFAENDWEAWSYFYKSSDFQIVGYEHHSCSIGHYTNNELVSQR